MRISDWSSDVCSSDLVTRVFTAGDAARRNLVTVIERPGVGIRAAIDSLDEHDRDYGLVIDRDRHVLGMVTADTLRDELKRNAEPRYANAFVDGCRSEEHTSELQSLMRNSYAVFCLKKNKK